MPIYQYKAMDRMGQVVQGQIEAESQQGAIAVLAEKGHFVDEIVPRVYTSTGPKTSQKGFKLRLSDKDLSEFIWQFATALQSQLPLITALQVVGQQNPSQKVKGLVAGLTEMITSGRSLSEAMARYPRIFDNLHLSMVAAGEASGTLVQSMNQMAKLLERELEIRNNILTAALYPAFVLCLGLISIVIVVTWILPQILYTLAGDVSQLPWPTKVTLAISGFIKYYGLPLLGAGVVLAFLVKRWKKTALGKYSWDRIKLAIPVFNVVQRKWAVSRFARTLGTLMQEGINILEALQIVRDTLGNEVLAQDIDKLATQVRTGSGLSQPLVKSGRFPPLLIQIVSVGEETGSLAPLLLGAADAFDRDTQTAVKRFMAIFPAVLILILALVVGFIVAATLLPIVQIETAIPGL
jgi:type II secretory pathway component PulF